MFTAALFITAKIWKQSKCPPTDEWIKKMCYVCMHVHTNTQHMHTHTHTHNVAHYSAIKKNEILSPCVATMMDPESILY